MPQWVSTLQFCWYEGHEDFRNFPLWFIPALFNASVLYKLIIIFSKDRWIYKEASVFVLTGVMLALKRLSVNLPLFIDVGVLALPYMLVGDFWKTKTSFIANASSTKQEWKVGLLAFLVFIVGYSIQASWSLFLVIDILKYVTAVAGSLVVLWIAKQIKHFSFLGVHLPLTAIRPLLMKFISNELIMKGVLFVVIVVIACVLAYLFNKYIPKLVGKMPLLNL